jgi:hypothetical protein
MTAGDEDQFGHDGENAGYGTEHGPGAAIGEHGLPGLHEGDHLPWLDSVEDEMGEAGVDPKRVWAFVLAGLALLALIVGGVWWSTHSGSQSTQVADGSTVAAPAGPIKAAPASPGGKTFEGTGDSSFAVSQGKTPGAKLANGGSDAVGAGAAAAKAGSTKTDGGEASGSGGGSKTASGIGVQVGAFSTEAAAESAWSRLAQAHDALSGVPHRILEGKADIGTVYRLQAVASSDDAASALCGKLKSAGVNCQVKD